MNDLVLKGGRIIDPAQDLDMFGDIAFTDGKVAAIGHDLSPADMPGLRADTRLRMTTVLTQRVVNALSGAGRVE